VVAAAGVAVLPAPMAARPPAELVVAAEGAEPAAPVVPLLLSRSNLIARLGRE